MLLDFRALFNWLRAALRPQPAGSPPPDVACLLAQPRVYYTSYAVGGSGAATPIFFRSYALALFGFLKRRD